MQDVKMREINELMSRYKLKVNLCLHYMYHPLQFMHRLGGQFQMLLSIFDSSTTKAKQSKTPTPTIHQDGCTLINNNNPIIIHTNLF